MNAGRNGAQCGSAAQEPVAAGEGAGAGAGARGVACSARSASSTWGPVSRSQRHAQPQQRVPQPGLLLALHSCDRIFFFQKVKPFASPYLTHL